MIYSCPCCGHNTLKEPNNSYEICPVCYWENDKLQNENPHFTRGANHISLLDAKENYKRYGCIQLKYLPYVREPIPTESSHMMYKEKQ